VKSIGIIGLISCNRGISYKWTAKRFDLKIVFYAFSVFVLRRADDHGWTQDRIESRRGYLRSHADLRRYRIAVSVFADVHGILPPMKERTNVF